MSVDFPEAVPHLRLIKNLRVCDVDLTGRGSIDSEILELVTLTKLRQLKIFADTARSKLGELAHLRNLIGLHLNIGELPAELDFIGALTHLQYLILLDTSKSNDFGFLSRLTELRIIGLLNSPIQNWVDRIANPAKIEHLSYRTANGDDLTPISLMPSLRGLHIFGSGPVDLAPLANRDLQVWLDDGVEAHGVDLLGPGVRLTRPKARTRE
jgi:hypothetical protein